MFIEARVCVFFLNVENKCDKTAKAIHWVGAWDGGRGLS